jgi:hypothetical protein
MAAKTIISTPYPTVEEVAAELGVSENRVRELRLLLEKIVGPRRKGRSAASRSTTTKKKKPSRR